MLAPILEIFIAIAAFLIEMIVHLLAGLFSSTFFATRSRGLLRAGYCVIALFCLYFLTAFGLAITGAGGTVLLSTMFSPFMLITSFVLWFIAIVVTASIHFHEASTTHHVRNPQTSKSSLSDSEYVIAKFAAYAAAIAIVFGLLTFYSTQSKRSTLREDLCAQIETRIGTNWLTKGEKLTELLEKKTGKKIFGKLNCPK